MRKVSNNIWITEQRLICLFSLINKVFGTGRRSSLLGVFSLTIRTAQYIPGYISAIRPTGQFGLGTLSAWVLKRLPTFKVCDLQFHFRL